MQLLQLLGLLMLLEQLAELNASESAETKVPLSTSIIFQKPETESSTLDELLQRHSEKISLQFHPIGLAPSIRPNTFKISGSQTVATVLSYLMRRLRLKHIHLYVSNTFQPTPDEKLGDLHELFLSNGVLVLGYCETIAFG